MNRRQFFQTAAGAAALLAARKSAFAYSVSPALQKFIQPMRIFGGGIPLAAPVPGKYDAGVDYYEITAGVYRDQLHPSLLNPTRLYGYSNTSGLGGQKHLGGAILGTTGKPVRIKFTNALPATHILPFDATIPMPNTGLRQDRAAIHLHGGLVPWASDGGPFHWVANPLNGAGNLTGASVVNWLPNELATLTPDYYYPNNQSARYMWYHDHAIGTTRTSAYASLATGYLLTDGTEAGLGGAGITVSPLDSNHLIMVFQDKVFWDPLVDPLYSTYAPGALPGDLWYPYLYEKQIWKLASGNNAKQGAGLPIPSAVAEMFGDTMLVNGLVFPYQVINQAQVYRLRMLNACNARFLNLSFVYEDPLVPGEPLLNKNKNQVPVAAPVDVWQIATEGGFLPVPVKLFTGGLPNFVTPLLLGPAERADILVDFSKVTPGSKVLFYNDAQAPYPAGNAMFDWFFGVKGVLAGFGPNTRTLMQFRMTGSPGAAYGGPPATINVPKLPTAPDPLNGGLMMVASAGGNTAATIGQTINIIGGPGVTYAGDLNLTLNEAFDIYGRLQQLIGTNVLNPATPGAFGRAYLDQPTEFVHYNKIYIWNIYNLTADAHPMHFHLFNVQVLRRRPFRVNQFNGVPIFNGPGLLPDPNEIGWKETVKVYPGMCTTVAVWVEDPLPGRNVNVRNAANALVGTGILPASPRLTAPPYNLSSTQADEYVWHCHILEHEEHDMMRPLVGGA